MSIISPNRARLKKRQHGKDQGDTAHLARRDIDIGRRSGHVDRKGVLGEVEIIRMGIAAGDFPATGELGFAGVWQRKQALPFCATRVKVGKEEWAMTLQEILQVIGGIGVIGSLIYVAIQVRNNARALRAATFLQISHNMQGALFNMASNEELASLVLRGGDDFSALSRIEKARFRFHGMFILSLNQNIYTQHKIGTLTNSDWDSFNKDLDSYFDMNGARQAWQHYKGRFNPEFQAYVERIIERAKAKESPVAHPFVQSIPTKKLKSRKAKT